MAESDPSAVTCRADGTGAVCSGKRTVVNVKQTKRVWFDVLFVDDDGQPIPNVDFVAEYENGKSKNCKADKDGYYREENAPEGRIKIKLNDGSVIEAHGSSDDFSKDKADPQNVQEAKVEYIIRVNDTLSKIAKRFGTTWGKIYNAVGPDGIKNSDRLISGDPNVVYAGETIWVPTVRRVVHIHTDNAHRAVTKVRVRGKGRTSNQQENARAQAVYQTRITHYAIDNLAIAPGWDDGNNSPDVKKLCDALTPVIRIAVNPRIGKDWNLYLIQKETMRYFDSSGNLQYTFQLSQTPKGLVGAYAAFERQGEIVIAGIYDPTCGLAEKGGEAIGVNDLVVGDQDKQKYLDGWLKLDQTKKTMQVLKLPIYYICPASKDEWLSIIWHGGNGLLDNYIIDAAYKSQVHDRNLAVLKAYTGVYQGTLNNYISKVKAISPEAGEDALRSLGKPPEPYKFPLPLGASSQQQQDLVTAMLDVSSYKAWLVISDKIFDIQQARWPSMSASHREGALYFRAKFTLEPSLEQKLNSLMDSHLMGHLSSYKTVKLEWNFDAGTDGIVTGKSYSHTFKEEGQIKAPKFEIGLGREVEISESGDQKVTIKGNLMGYGLEVASDGDHKISGKFGAQASFNNKTMECGQGLGIDIPGIGSIYLGVHFQSVRSETLLVIISGAPGYIERRSCDKLVKTFWKDLTFPEEEKLRVLGWDQNLWDVKDQLKANKLPQSTRTAFDQLTPKQRLAAIHLGFQKKYADNWLDFWKKLPPVQEEKQSHE
jgi:hypothetical protein